MQKSAVISSCGQFRYRLSRRWADGPALVFIMLNPSIADADIDDPTIRKCVAFATLLGYCAIEIVNLYAFRATKPDDLKKAGWSVGVANNTHIIEALTLAAIHDSPVICAWGAHARGRQRAVEVIDIIRRMSLRPMALRKLSDGVPEHPLYIPYSCTPVDL